MTSEREWTDEERKKLRRPIYQLKISLDHTEPLIWRRVLVSGNRSMKKLHEIIQIAFGWTESHLHVFKFPDGSAYTDLNFELDYIDHGCEATNKLRKLAKTKGCTFKYEYDFGDDWCHSIEVEEILSDSSGWEPRCIAGEGAGPPEDIGGVPGYCEFLEAMSDPEHERHAEFKGWIDEDWKPVFDMEATNRALRAAIKIS